MFERLEKFKKKQCFKDYVVYTWSARWKKGGTVISAKMNIDKTTWPSLVGVFIYYVKHCTVFVFPGFCFLFKKLHMQKNLGFQVSIFRSFFVPFIQRCYLKCWLEKPNSFFCMCYFSEMEQTPARTGS